MPLAVKKNAELTSSKVVTSKPSTASQSNHLKRKSMKGTTPQNGDIDGHSIDGEGSVVDEDGHDDASHKPTKKRRVSKGNAGPSRAQLVKAVSDMEASIKRIQASVTKEVEKMSSIVKSLNARIKEMDDD